MSSDIKTIFDPAEMESLGEKLGYGKDSKERLPWEHYLSQYQESDPKEIAARLGIFYDEEQKYFTLKFLGTVYQHQVAGNSKPTEKCRGVKYTFGSLTDAVSSGWHSPMETVSKIFRQSWNTCTVFR